MHFMFVYHVVRAATASTSRSTCTCTSRSTCYCIQAPHIPCLPRTHVSRPCSLRPNFSLGSYRTTYKQLMVGTMVCSSSTCSIGVSFDSFARLAHPTDAFNFIYRRTSSCENFRKVQDIAISSWIRHVRVQRLESAYGQQQP